MQCEICNSYEAKSLRSLALHIASKHKDTSLKDYYDKYLKSEGEGICSRAGCGKECAFKGLTIGYSKYCSVKCISLDQRSKDSGYWEKLKEKCLEENGVEFYSSIKSNRAHAKETRIKKYGKFHSDETLKKIAETTKSNFGTSCILSDKSKRKDWEAERLSKKGYKYTLESKAAQDKSKESRNTDEFNLSFRSRFIETFKSKLKAVNCEFLSILPDNQVQFKCLKCGEITTESRNFVFTDRSDKSVSPCLNCLPKQSSISVSEINLCNDIKEMLPNEEIIQCDRSILNGKEIDIYFPRLKVGIEYDGLYFHREDKVGKSFHLDKTEACKKLGITLIHIFSDEYEQHKDIVLSRLRSILGCIQDRIYARKCTVEKIIDRDIVKKFLNANHIQGFCIFKYAYALKFESEIVAMMTFGSSRFEKNETELLRYCNKLNTSVVGGAGKLLSIFRHDHPEINSLVSYADRRWSTGKLYESLGFKLVSITKPSYSYFKTRKEGRKTRWDFQRRKIAKDDNDRRTEREIAAEMGYYRIYDCGQLKFKI